jgi:hypothetical protein
MRPRNRWIKLFLIAFFFSISVPITYFVVVGPDDPVAFHRDFRVWKAVLALIGIFLLCFLVVGVAFAMRQYPVQVELEEFENRQKTGSDKGHRDYPGVTVVPDYSPPIDGPGHYRIEGVDQNTKDDVTRDIHADSLANAKVKAELDGIIVTSIIKTT